MKIDPNKLYQVSVLIEGHYYWSKPMEGRRCNSIGIQRTTVREVGLFLASFACSNPSKAELIEVYELPQPCLIINGPFTVS